MKKSKLNKLSDQHLAERQMNMVRGGDGTDKYCMCCCCACAYEGTPGGSTTANNYAANTARGLKSNHPRCEPEVGDC
jgi:natural product precursor